MTLTDEQKQILFRKLTFLRATQCQICNHANWMINDSIFEMREFQGGDLIIGGKNAILPVISVMCKNCGNIILLNALILGMIEPKK